MRGSQDNQSESTGASIEATDGVGAKLEALQAKTALFPHLPGVYLFRDGDGVILYVGKARDLKKRIVSYFRSGDSLTPKTRVLLSRSADLEYVVTANEKEALLLEASLIKKHRPRYNVVLRDDKSYPVLRIDLAEPFPRLEVVRRLHRDGALYFGPYPSVLSLRDTLKVINQLFPLRLCKGRKLVPRDRPCLNFSLGRCLGACAGKVSREDYRKVVDEVVLFLQGKTDVLQQQLKARMEEAAAVLAYERAAFYRDRLRSIAAMLEKQHVVSDRFLNQDVLGIHQEADATEVVVLFVRQGVLVGQRAYDLKDAPGEPAELLGAFVQQFYGEGRTIPDEVLLPLPLESQDLLAEWLSDLKGKRVRVWPASRGDRKRLLEMAAANARERHASRRRSRQKGEALLTGLQRALKLPRLPMRMACVDISNIQGQHAVGSLVVFESAHPDKSSYRHFKITSKSEPDDPAMMAEVVDRLVSNEQALFEGLDLLVLDGGKGQLNRIEQLLKQKGREGAVSVISIAKERDEDIGDKGKGLYEKIYIPGRKNPVMLSKFPDILHLLMRLRDEAHRFAISHYQATHRNELLTSVLDKIPGVGPRRRQVLLQHFSGIDAIQRASAEDLARLPGITVELAAAILRELGGLGEESEGTQGARET